MFYNVDIVLFYIMKCEIRKKTEKQSGEEENN